MNTYEHQRWICRQAREHGWNGQEPSVLGTHHANLVIAEAQAFLRALPESCRALMWDQYSRDNVPTQGGAARDLDYVDWGSGELLAMAALDHYPIDDGLPKSTSVVFRIHQLGRAWQAAKDALQAEKVVSQKHFDYYLSEHHRCEMARLALERIATGMDLRFAETAGMVEVAREALERTRVKP